MADFVSVIVPCRNEERYIDGVIRNLLDQDYPKDKMEFIFVDGKSSDKTRQIIESFKKDFSFIKILENPAQVVPHALNLGIEEAKGDIIVRIDAHADYPRNYISLLVDKLEQHSADNVGTSLETVPYDDSALSGAIACAFSSIVGVGSSTFRVGADVEKQVDTVPFGCFRKEVFSRFGLFDEELICNQDDEFNGRIIKNKGKIVIIPSLIVKYFARKNLKSVARMFFQYGYFKPLVAKRLGSPATLRQLAPPLFVIFLLLLVGLSFNSKIFTVLLLAFASLYVMAVCSLMLPTLKKKSLFSIRTLLLSPVVTFVMHASYGVGYILGVLDFFILGNNKTTLIKPALSR